MEGTSRQFQARPERLEALFANKVAAYRDGSVLWLDFIQEHPATQQPYVVSRVVLRADRLDDLISKLSDLRGR